MRLCWSDRQDSYDYERILSTAQDIQTKDEAEILNRSYNIYFSSSGYDTALPWRIYMILQREHSWR